MLLKKVGEPKRSRKAYRLKGKLVMIRAIERSMNIKDIEPK